MTTEDIIYNTAIKDGIPSLLATFIIAQSKLETANYSHHFFKIGNNCFGYSYDKNSIWQIKPGGKADNHVKIAQYQHIEDSVFELTSWIKRRQKDGQFPKDLNVITTPMLYAKYLREGKHPYGGLSTEQYGKGIQTWLKKSPYIIK